MSAPGKPLQKERWAGVVDAVGSHTLANACAQTRYRGTVAASSEWGGPMEWKSVRPSLPHSYERLCHDARVPAFMLHLREPARADLRDELMEPRLERAIGVIYRPETERQSHYFQAVLPEQFDEYVWFDETSAVEPLPVHEVTDAPDTYPFGL